MRNRNIKNILEYCTTSLQWQKGNVGKSERKISKGENIDKGYLTAKKANYVYRKAEAGI